MSDQVEPQIGNTRPLSFAAISTEQTPKGVLTFHCRKNTEREWRVIELRELDRARSIVQSQLNSVSTAPSRTVLLNDDIHVDMPAVDLDQLERMFREETVLGKGRKFQIFVVVYDHDPTALDGSAEGATASFHGMNIAAEVSATQGRREKSNGCGCAVL